MNLTLTEEQRALADMVRSLAAGLAGPSTARQRLEGADPPDHDGWTRLAAAGLAGLLVGEAAGGGGAGPVEATIVAEHLGAKLSPLPFIATAVEAATLLRDAEDRCRAIAAGTSIVGVVRLTDPVADDGTLTGADPVARSAAGADLLVVVTPTEVATVDPAAQGVDVTPVATVDATQSVARVDLAAAPATVVSGGESAVRTARAALLLAQLALAAEQVGVAQAALDMAVAYARIREQFGRPIGSFQAIKHRCADMLSALEAARSTVLMAAHAMADGDDEAALLVSAASVLASDAAIRCTEDNIQVHGGIGFTWEHDAHLYLRRARATRPLLGDPDAHLDLIAAEAGW